MPIATLRRICEQESGVGARSESLSYSGNHGFARIRRIITDNSHWSVGSAQIRGCRFPGAICLIQFGGATGLPIAFKIQHSKRKLPMKLTMFAFYLFLSILLTAPAQAADNDIEKRVEHGYADSGGVKIHYAALGDKKNPLIV